MSSYMISFTNLHKIYTIYNPFIFKFILICVFNFSTIKRNMINF